MRYHKKFGFPDTLILPDEMFQLKYTNHAKRRRKRKHQFWISRLPVAAKVCERTITEVHTSDNVTVDIAVVKVHYTHKKNLVLVLQLNLKEKTAIVITIWMKYKKDTYNSLNTSLYNNII